MNQYLNDLAKCTKEKLKRAKKVPYVARNLDHFVNIVGDVEIGSKMYEHLGFRVMPVMEHVSIGTSNVCVQFDQTYIELIGDFEHANEKGFIEIAAPWTDHADYIYWQTSLTSSRLEDEGDALRQKGYDPQKIVSAARRVRKIGGGWDETQSRSRYTYDKKHITGSLFMSDHGRPETIWMPDYPTHPNTVKRVAAITYIAKNPLDSVIYFSDMLGGAPLEASDQGVIFCTPRGEFLEILPETVALPPSAPFVPLQDGLSIRGAGFVFVVENLNRCQLALRDGGVPHSKTGEAIFVNGAYGCGMSMTFATA